MNNIEHCLRALFVLFLFVNDAMVMSVLRATENRHVIRPRQSARWLARPIFRL